MEKRGISLLETLLVLAILIIISSLAFIYLPSYRRNLELVEGANNILNYLRKAQSKAMAGEDDREWGIHFVNSTNDYFELYSTETIYSEGQIKEIIYLSELLEFNDPAVGFTKDIQFSKISGKIGNLTSVIICLKETTNCQTISVTTEGKISIE
jgi:type II secretory pathway pseudopilin PulG